MRDSSSSRSNRFRFFSCRISSTGPESGWGPTNRSAGKIRLGTYLRSTELGLLAPQPPIEGENKTIPVGSARTNRETERVRRENESAFRRTRRSTYEGRTTGCFPTRKESGKQGKLRPRLPVTNLPRSDDGPDPSRRHGEVEIFEAAGEGTEGRDGWKTHDRAQVRRRGPAVCAEASSEDLRARDPSTTVAPIWNSKFSARPRAGFVPWRFCER